ncbi:MAG: type II toxin-antitoxin system HicB family antitoxin [Magnetococcus sp. YQC-3]
MANLDDYPFEISKLSAEDGGGYLISFTDFNECISDGETVAEAIENGMDALKGMILSMEDLGIPVPLPRSGGASGRFVTRVPKQIHAKLTARAKREGVSLNMLVATLLAEGLGIRSASA